MAVLLQNFTLAGAKEQGAPGSGSGVQPPKGNYEVRISETKAHTTSEGKASVLVQLQFTGDYEGAECRVYLGTDFSTQGVRNGWLTALKSVGTDESILAQLSDGRVFDGINTAEYLDGKTGYIFYTPKDEEAGKRYSEQRFITREAFLSGGAKAQTAANTVATTPKVSLSVAGPAAAAKPVVAAAPVAAAGVPKPLASQALGGFLNAKQ
jgi:hypothetical protein